MSYQGGPYWQYPQYPAPPPLPPPPPRRPSRWPAFATERGILLYVLAPLLAVLLIVVLAVGISAARRQTVASVPTPTIGPPAPTITPQGTPLPTDTPTSAPQQLVAGPTIGGVFEDFSAAYGPTSSADVWNATIAGQQTQFMVTFSNDNDSSDGTPRGIIINVVTPDFAGWDATTSAQIAAAFLPPDARFVNATPGPTGHTDHNYLSAQLANSLVASVFTTDDLSRQVTPGSLYWTCDASTGCYISVGTYN